MASQTTEPVATEFAPGITGGALTLADRAILLLLRVYGAAALLFLALVPLRFLPAEDAVILFAYSRNLAQHGAISFLAGGPHVEGATDFGWMCLIAAAMRCGVAPFWFCAVANVAALLLLAATLLRLAGRRVSVAGVLAVAGAAALFRPIFAAASGFGVLPDAALLALLVLCVVRQRPAAASLGALALCLFRPDSVVFAVPLLLGMMLKASGEARSQARSKAPLRSLGPAVALFVVPGVGYFLWRWHYFGELLPLPLLVKGTFHHRVLGIFISGSIRASLVPLLYTALALLPLFLRSRSRTRPGRLWLIVPLILLPTLFYWTMRLDQNVGGRFYFYLPLSVALLLAVHWLQLETRRALTLRVAFGAWLVLLAAPLYRELLTFRSMQFATSRAIAEDLARLPKHGSILVTEAGFVPYYSGWPSTDAWGLNTPEFAHRFFQADDVARLAPDLIVLHPDLDERCTPLPGWQSNYTDRQWPLMTRNIIEGAPRGEYALWLTSYGSEFYRQRKHWSYGEGDRECWLVRKRSPLRADIERILSVHHGVEPDAALRLEGLHDPRTH